MLPDNTASVRLEADPDIATFALLSDDEPLVRDELENVSEKVFTATPLAHTML